MVSPRSCAVPAELQLDIIEHLHDDERALRNCSLVCQIWADYSRNPLWRKTALISKDEAGAVSHKHTVFMGGEEVRYFFRATSMEDATAFFSANPSTAKLVKMFRIEGFTGVTVNILASLLAVLPSLSHLDIVCTDFPPLPDVLSDIEREQLITKPVYTRQLDYVYFRGGNIVGRDTDMLLRVLGLFSSIDTLVFEGPKRVYDVQVDGWSLDPTTHLRHDVPHPLQPEVCHLIPEAMHPSVLGYLFNGTALARNLKDLRLFPPNIWTYSDLRYMAHTLLPPLSGTLDRLHFVPGPCMGVVLPQGLEEDRAIDAALTRIANTCASVKHLAIDWIHNLMPGWQPLDFSYLFEGFVTVLERMPPSAALETLDIGLFVEDAAGIVPPRTVPTTDVLKEYNWPGLERVLLKGPRGKVRVNVSISFVSRVAPTDERQGLFAHTADWQLQFAKDVMLRMKKLYDTGRLDVRFGEMRTQYWGLG